MSYTSTGKLGRPDAERREHLVRAVVGRDGRHGLRHPAEDDPPGLVSFELDGDDPVARLERDHAQLQRRAEDERGAEAGMPGERDLVAGREDANANGAAFARRQDEHALGEAKLERQLLHRQLVEVARVGEDGQLVARERPVGEDVGDDIAKRTHRAQTTAAPMIDTWPTSRSSRASASRRCSPGVCSTASSPRGVCAAEQFALVDEIGRAEPVTPKRARAPDRAAADDTFRPSQPPLQPRARPQRAQPRRRALPADLVDRRRQQPAGGGLSRRRTGRGARRRPPAHARSRRRPRARSSRVRRAFCARYPTP